MEAKLDRFKALVEPRLETLYRVARRLTGNRTDAEDLVQETCLNAWQKLPSEAEPAHVDRWLFRVLYHRFVDGTRRKRRSPPSFNGAADSTETLPSPTPGPYELAVRDQSQRAFNRAWLKLEPGQKATVTLAGGAAQLSGKVRLVEPTLDPQSRLGHVYIRFDEPGKARAGMFASAEIVAAEKEGLTLPLSAVTATDGKTVARKVENGIVTLVPVETGIQDGQAIEIVKGLSAGDEVVAKAGAYVRDGDRVNPVHAEEASARK